MAKNPFEILGIAPEMVRELDNEALYGLVKACYRALQRAYHPDLKNGTKERAVELNLAFEALDWERDPESFKKHRQAYLRRLSRRTQRRTIDELTQKVAALLRQQELLTENYWQHLLEVLKLTEGPTLFPEPPRMKKITLLDVCLKFNVSFAGFGRPLAFKEILFDEEGFLYYRFPKRRKFHLVSFITLVGSVPRRYLEIWPLLEKKPSPERTGSGLPNPKDFEVLNIIQLEVFKRSCLPLLKTGLQEDAYLFSIHHRRSSPKHHIFLEGMILRIQEATPKDFDKVVKRSKFFNKNVKKLPPPLLALEE